ncbi:phosphatidyl inositol 3-kinase-like protein [Xylariaceae sp. FL0804]|nr:phosphatidyl inositol 3-kinase-like protein [Xylariaceae sp. FL0804]
MPPTSHGRPDLANGSLNHGPPPSTLAAQLVENISTSNRSSRPDETAELQKLFGLIEKVKDQPDLLTSPEERRAHNHMLIYVYARVVLDGLRWDDPFANRSQLRADASRALSFLRITVKETPEVLLATAEPGSFLFRGPEPLWLWIFPRVLRMLGCRHCAELTPAIEDFFQDVYVAISQASLLWSLISPLLSYVRRNFEAIIGCLEQSRTSVTGGATPFELRLPMDSYLESLGGCDLQLLQQQCTYTISSESQALEHAFGLLSLVSISFSLPRPRVVVAPSFQEFAPWLLDSQLFLHQTSSRRDGAAQANLPRLLQSTLQLLEALWDVEEAEPSIREKACAILVLFCAELAAQRLSGKSPRSVAAGDERVLHRSLLSIAKACLTLKPLSRLVSSQLIPSLDKLNKHENATDADSDLGRCLTLLRRLTADSAPAALNVVVEADQFSDEDLRSRVRSLPITSTHDRPRGQQAKRRKIGQPQALPGVISEAWRALGQEARPSLDGFQAELLSRFSQLPDSARCHVIQLLGFVCCAADDSLSVVSEDGDGVLGFDCPDCRNPKRRGDDLACLDTSSRSIATDAFVSILQVPSFVEARRPRIAAMVSLRRIARHCGASSFLDLEVSVAAQWCLKSLQSSVRELRIAAGRTIAVFLASPRHPHVSQDVVDKNRSNVLNILRKVSEQGVSHLTESWILAWSQVAMVVSEDQLNLVLVKLVEYLGHESDIVSAAAFTEIVRLARYRSTTPRQLFEPFWRYLAFSAVKDMITRPKLVRSLAELVDMGVPQLLLHVQGHALPWLVLTRKNDVIQKIAEVRNEAEPWQPCLDNRNLGGILALLLIQDTSDSEEYAMTLLRHVSPHFNESNLIELLLMEPLMTTFELLKMAADAEESRKPTIREALIRMANNILAAHGEPARKKAHSAGRFLQQHALGLMARLTDVINDVSWARAPMQERKRCIKAMEEMIRTGRYYIHIARPQISACLLAAMPHEEMRAVAFSCWAAMQLHLQGYDVEVLIETTFFLISHYWAGFEASSQALSRQLLQSLLEDHRENLTNVISKLPSFSHINELSDIEAQLSQLRSPVDRRTAILLLAERISHENTGVVLQALGELVSYLQRQQGYLQASAVSEQPDSVVPDLVRALLDCASRYNGTHSDIADLCTRCIGLVGCLDPNLLESVRAEKSVVVLSNFEDAGEVTDFSIFMLKGVLLKSFISATDTKLQGFLSYAMQELLDRCDLREAVKMQGAGQAAPIYRKWELIPESAREILTPFITSRYVIAPMPYQEIEYPIFRPGKPYGNWMRNLTLDCLRRPQAPFAHLVFEPLCRLIRVKDLSIAEFLFPYVLLHIILGEEIAEHDRTNILCELLIVLQHELPSSATWAEREDKKLYCEAIFRFLDYAMRWVQLKRTTTKATSTTASRATPRDIAAIAKVQAVLDSFPAELISQRAVDCSAYSRALFHLEQHIRDVDTGANGVDDRDRLLQRLQDIYTQIDEPDGLEGISAHLQVLDINQQVLSHRKAGRWGAAQTWYEIKLAEDPDNVDVQIDLLTCLKESGQHDALLNYVEGIEKHTASATINRIVPYAVEAAWATGRWQTMQSFVGKYRGDHTEDFNVSIAQSLLHLQKGWTRQFLQELKTIRDRVGSSMTFSATSSLQACHVPMLRSHVLTDLELVAGLNNDGSRHPQETLKSLDRRLEVIGSYVTDKQYVLGIRRAAMQLMRPRYGDTDISAVWLSSARLARKANAMHQSFNAVLHASQLGDGSATIENARLLWKEGHNRKAIQTLEGALASKVFLNQSFNEHDAPENSSGPPQNMLTARAQLLLAKWLDSAGQTHASALRQQYRKVPLNHGAWEKGHYYLGRHYKKVLESEKGLKPDDQSDEYLTGETAKLVIENYLRSLACGTKYLYQTLPRILTLWLELGAQVDRAPESKVALSGELRSRRKTQLAALHKYLLRYVAKLPAYIFYTALPQLVARIAHPNNEAAMLLQEIIVRVVEAHPRQALWSLFAIMTPTQASSERRARGQQILMKLKDQGSKSRAQKGTQSLSELIRAGEKLANQLLLACNNGEFRSNRTTVASITRDLKFNHKCTPCPLVVPIETCLAASLPTLTDNVRQHQAFSPDVITISSFLDEVLVLGSLAKPRKLTARGSNGVNYGLLIKPKDDLRTDQRLMEFNSMINRSLKHDAESSRRQLYIRTYAVVPLNEECGIIEWVEGLKTLRDILLNIYESRGIAPNYGQLQHMMKEAVLGDNNIGLWTEGVLGTFPPVLPSWFTAQFPNPSAWFAARLRYTRSCAVMSMVGTILGLGDRHGENVLLEEGNGGVFHVDFNCLFDKGLTFVQPERVPFRLTHNMVAAMGVYGHEGPFRRCSELTLRILRQQEETLMTILEAFIYDPTLDLQRDSKKHRRKHEVVRLDPQSVVSSIRRKVVGLLPDESIPLGVEGQVEELIKQAVNPRNLSAMYIGWCPFL